MNNTQQISITSEQEASLPLIAMLICGKVQTKITNQQVRVMLEACLSQELSTGNSYWFFSAINSSLSKVDLDFFMSSYVMQRSQSNKRQMIAWAIRFIRVSKDALSIKNSLAILFKMIDLLKFDSSRQVKHLKNTLLKKYPKFNAKLLDKKLGMMLDGIGNNKDSSCGENKILRKFSAKWYKQLLYNTQIKLPNIKQVDTPDSFIKLLSGSLSLNTAEKMRVINSYSTLSQFQVDQLCKVWEDEKIQFISLKEEHPGDIEKLEIKCAVEWFSIYSDWAKNVAVESKLPEGLEELAKVFSAPENRTDTLYKCNYCGYSEETNKIRVKKNNNECPMCSDPGFIKVEAA